MSCLVVTPDWRRGERCVGWSWVVESEEDTLVWSTWGHDVNISNLKWTFRRW